MISMNNKIRVRFVSAYRLAARSWIGHTSSVLWLNFQCSVLALGEVREILMKRGLYKSSYGLLIRAIRREWGRARELGAGTRYMSS